MKKIALSYVAVKRITSSVPVTEFDDTDLAAAARTSLELGGFIQPPVLRRTGNAINMSYEVVTGHFQYHAAVIASKWDWENGETIGCIIIEEETKRHILRQLKIVPNNILATESITSEEIATPAPEVEAVTINSANDIEPQSLTEIKIGRTRFNIELQKEYKGASWWWTCQLVSNRIIYDRCVLAFTETGDTKQWVLTAKTNAGVLKGRFAWFNNEWQAVTND